MERVLSDYEKIKRAEEIYNRRKMQGVGGVRVAGPKNEKSYRKELSNVKKMLIQICVCIVLYIIVYIVQNSNYIFSEQFINKTKELLTYDMNFGGYITEIYNNFNEYLIKENVENEEENVQENNLENEVNVEEQNVIVDGISIVEENVVEENTMSVIEEKKEDVVVEKTQMEIDADDIKENYQFQLPVKGEITSGYGPRQIVPKFHVGVDIGADTGTEIIAAFEGVVILVSEKGDYGKHIKIKSGDVENIYAHCSKLCVAEGQSVNVGEKIAEVGQTGNATGPHLHFEILYKRKICKSRIDYEMVIGEI